MWNQHDTSGPGSLDSFVCFLPRRTASRVRGDVHTHIHTHTHTHPSLPLSYPLSNPPSLPLSLLRIQFPQIRCIGSFIHSCCSILRRYTRHWVGTYVRSQLLSLNSNHWFSENVELPFCIPHISFVVGTLLVFLKLCIFLLLLFFPSFIFVGSLDPCWSYIPGRCSLSYRW